MGLDGTTSYVRTSTYEPRVRVLVPVYPAALTTICRPFIVVDLYQYWYCMLLSSSEVGKRTY